MPDKLLSTDPGAGRLLSPDPQAGETSEQPGSSGGLVLGGVAKTVPVVRDAAMELATSPNVPKVAAKVGRAGGAIGSVVGGAMSGEPIAGVVGAAKGAWLGGKTGWHSGKLLQNVSAPVAKALEKIAPYAQGIATLGGVQSGLDVAQMADPNRTDIGTLGMGSSPTPELYRKAMHLAVQQGTPPVEAARQLARNDPRKFAAIMTDYAKSIKGDIELPSAKP